MNKNKDHHPTSQSNSNNACEAELISVTSGNAEEKPKQTGQFKILTLLSWTGVTCFLLAVTPISRPDFSNSYQSEWFERILFFSAALLPPWMSIPFLIDQLFDKQSNLQFTLFRQLWLILCVSVYSVLMIMLATVAFAPDWQGMKGPNWFYYTLDGFAGVSFWPIYGLGAYLFARGVNAPQIAKRNPLILTGVITCAAISFWYTFAALYLSFIEKNSQWLVMIPAGCGICYSLFAAIIWRNKEFPGLLGNAPAKIYAWISFLIGSVLIKYPLAKQAYEALPSEAPEGCFIVTAATRGHPNIVGSWFDPNQERMINKQLIEFWKFESHLKARLPRTHQLMRSVYNRVGPIIARMVIFRWQADCLYLLLKPIELLAQRSNELEEQK